MTNRTDAERELAALAQALAAKLEEVRLEREAARAEAERLRGLLRTLVDTVDARLLADSAYQEAARLKRPTAVVIRIGDTAADAIVAEHLALKAAREALEEGTT